MPARPSLTNVVNSSWTQPTQSGKSKTVTLQAGLLSFANIGNSAATTNTITVDADYGIYDTTVAQNCTVEATNFKDPA